jgi:N-6 DNA Methylase
MDSQQTFSLLLEKLEYKTSPNLVLIDGLDESISEVWETTWREAKEKLHIDAIYFVANSPIIYFKQFDTYDEKDIAELHRKIWNQSQAPLVFAIMPDDIRVYNGYEAPQRTSLTGIIEPNRLDHILSSSAFLSLWERLAIFSRLAIESGSFWRDYGQYFRRENRADQKLIANLRYIRRHLITDGKLSPEHVHSLIGRSIFAFYLQDRGVLPQGYDGFFAKTFGQSYTCYTDILLSYETTYRFFTILRNHFNGDMFPVTKEEMSDVKPDHLAMLRSLFTTDIVSGGQLLFFWAYNFEFIPIELISAIYEEFLYQEESGKDGAYYTPPMLVDFMLDQVLPWNTVDHSLRILDPACGSGIFLVEAYRRLVERWRKAHNASPPRQVLSKILTDSIFGVDIKRQALRVAAFSLYLALLDYLEPKAIWVDVQFPSLIGTNLLETDFFDEKLNNQFANNLFDIIVGNPPWESQLTLHAQAFLKKNERAVGDKQIAQAFLWRAPQFCNTQAQIALLCSSKSLLFNKSGPNLSFRKAFFKSFSVTKIFDFSAMRRFLFEKGTAPAVAIFYTTQGPDHSSSVFYGAPKLTHLTRRFAAIVIESNDIKSIPVWQILASMENIRKRNILGPSNHTVQQTSLFEENEGEEEDTPKHYINIWKVALWGTNQDYLLLQDLDHYPSLEEVVKSLGWYGPQGGFNRSGPDKEEYKHFSWLDNIALLDGDNFTLYGVNEHALKKMPAGEKYYRGGDPRLFKAPFVLFKRGQAKKRPGAAFSNHNFAYTTSMTGISGPLKDSDLLKALTALLNSNFAQYYWFLTSSSWGVEREELTVGELKNVPFPFLNVESNKIRNIAILVDELATLNVLLSSPHSQEKAFDLFFQRDILSKRVDQIEQELNHNIYDCFGLNEQEVRLIDECVQYTIGFFNSPEKSIALQQPTDAMQVSYAKTYVEALNFYLEPIGRKLTATLFNDQSLPMIGVRFVSVRREEDIPAIQQLPPNSSMFEALPNLYHLSLERSSKNVYHRRNYRIYDSKDAISIFKPAEGRLWTSSSALKDAEETIAELLHTQKVSK